MSAPYGKLPRLPLLLLLVICVLAIILSLQEVVAAESATTSSRDDRTASHTTSPTCVPLQGIESNATGGLDPNDFLDLDVIRVSLKDEIFNLTNPVLQTFGECSAILETPIAMRILLGEYRHRRILAASPFGDAVAKLQSAVLIHAEMFLSLLWMKGTISDLTKTDDSNKQE